MGEDGAPKNLNPGQGEDLNKGHRARLRDRFLKAGSGGLQSYELLELILYRSIPRRDVKPLAKEMIRAFGSFADVLAASRERLVEFKGISDATAIELKIIQAAAIELARENIMEQPVLTSWQDLLAYCRISMAYDKIEQFRVLFLNNKNRLIADEKQNSGTVNQTSVYPREVIKRALALEASAIILVHNHPSGDPTPSPADIDMTKRIYDAGRVIGIKLHDHLVIGRGSEVSFKALGLL